MDPLSPVTILARELGRLTEGEALDLDSICDRHPEQANELRSLAPILGDMIRELRASGVIADPVASGHSADELRGRLPSAAVKRVLEKLRRRPQAGPRYELRGEVARGGMGSILRVHDTDLDRDLAMKVTLTSVQEGAAKPPEDDLSVGRFLEEARITGRLDHPGVIPVHELGLDDQGRVFFTMRLVRGRDLSVIFKLAREERDGWSLTRAVSALQRVCETMAFAHTRGVIHRDLKPANVMAGRFGEVYVLDWGLARIEGSEETPSTEAGAAAEEPRMTQRGDVLGTPPFMSPEQAAGDIDAVDHRTDIYAAGAMLYELLTGAMPYVNEGAGSPVEVLVKIAAGPPQPVREIARDVPPELEAICERAMARERSARYADMEAMANDLRAFLEGRVVRAYRTGAWAELKKWVQRNRALAASLGAALLLLLAGVSSVAYTEARGRRLVLRLADGKRLAELRERVPELWPIGPEKAEAMREWLGEARDLAEKRRMQHGKDLASLRRGAETVPTEDATAELTRQRNAVAGLARESVSAADDTVLEPLVRRERERLAELEASAPVSYRIEDTEDAWWESQLAPLIEELDAFASPEGLLALVSTSLELADGIHAATVETPAVLWERSATDIAASPVYGGLQLEPQLGLLPLSPDPASGLWEFLVHGTGVAPERGADGRFVVRGDTGIVLVLVPAGTFWMGAEPPSEQRPLGSPNVDPSATDAWAPVHQVTLDPYLIAKHEVTQGQWLRISASNPSDYNARFFGDSEPDPLRRPVERVTWEHCMEWLPRFRLTLPTEAQWECAARAGTRTVYWCNDDPETMARCGNVSDQFLKENGGNPLYQYAPWNDGWDTPGPVDLYEPNPFGLHLVIGNVEEWCLDGYRSGTPDHWINSYELPWREGTGERMYVTDEQRVARGGNYDFIHGVASSANRSSRGRSEEANRTGLRPVRILDGAPFGNR